MTPMHIRNERKAKAFIKNVGKKRKRKEADAELGEGAGKRLERLESDVKALVEIVAGLSVTVGKLWAWKLMQEMEDE